MILIEAPTRSHCGPIPIIDVSFDHLNENITFLAGCYILYIYIRRLLYCYILLYCQSLKTLKTKIRKRDEQILEL